jgi:hypothetical protein
MHSSLVDGAELIDESERLLTKTPSGREGRIKVALPSHAADWNDAHHRESLPR